MLSIIIPTLNEQEYLPKLLESIKKQDFTGEYEVIVADAGSKDGTLSIAKSYGCIITSGGLPAKGRNEGAKLAKGDILLFLDSDVILSPHFLKNSVEEFTKGGLGIAGFALHLIDGKKGDNRSYVIMRSLAKMLHWAAVAIMTTRQTYDTVGGFDEEVTFCEDILYVLAASKISRYGYINQSFFTSARRYATDGKITYVKYVLGYLYTLFLGPIKSDMFHYKFNHYKKNG